MEQQIVALIAALGPTVLWISLIGVVLWRFEEPIRREVLPRIGSVGFMGFSMSFAQKVAAEGLTRPGESMSRGVSERVARRLSASGDLLREASILWLDDHPEHNVMERRFFARTGAWIEPVRSLGEALEALKWSRYQVVISDIRRDQEVPLRQITDVDAQLGDARIVFYVSHLRPGAGKPQGAYDIVAAAEDLYCRVIDILEEQAAPG